MNDNGVATAATDLWRQGWAVVPIPAGRKRPIVPEWEKLRLDEDAIPAAFASSGNVGILLGEPSGWLVDVDLDVAEAVRIAPALLPETARKSGRPGNPTSHYWYTATGTITERFKAPDGTMLVELRSTGCQTVVPPSTHPSGEVISWEASGAPGEVGAAPLRDAVARVAAGALLARSWPKEGARDLAALALTGVLLRGAWDAEDVDDFVAAVAQVAGDEEWPTRKKAKGSAVRLGSGRNVAGWPTLKELFGPGVVDRVQRWLGLDQVVAPKEKAPTVDTPISDLDRRWVEFTEAELTVLPDPARWVWRNNVQEEKAGVLAGKGGAGKTALSVGLAIHRAIERPFLGSDVVRGRTVFVSTEDGVQEYLRAIASWRHAMPGLDMGAVARHLSLLPLSGTGVQLVDVSQGRYVVTSSVGDLADVIRRRAGGADFVVAETVSRLGGDESNEAMSRLVVAAEMLSSMTAASVMLMAHIGKAAARDKSGDAYITRGGSAIVDNGRFTLTLATPTAEEVERLTGFKPDEKAAEKLLRLHAAKVNAAPPQEPVILERLPSPWGIALRLYRPAVGDPGAARATARAEVGERLRQLVKDLAGVGIVATPTSLRDNHREALGLSRHRVIVVIKDAIQDGYVGQGEVVRGGGRALYAID